MKSRAVGMVDIYKNRKRVCKGMREEGKDISRYQSPKKINKIRKDRG